MAVIPAMRQAIIKRIKANKTGKAIGAAKSAKIASPTIVARFSGVFSGLAMCFPRTVAMISLAASLGLPKSSIT
ncbi:Uncharacterised protein [Chlamydia trachomatis]|nr:Uncharacterised protein [Chlamydia trachomatis]